LKTLPILAALALASPATAAPEGLDLCDFKPVMNEDFTSFLVKPHKLDGARWTAHTPWNGDFGDARFTDPGPNGPFAVNDGELTITAKRGADGKWRSGLIAAADASGAGTGVQYGYFEARMRFPPGPGLWPSFWLASLKPANDLSPGVEIDAVEYHGHADDVFSSALHVWYKGPDKHEDKAKSRHATQRTAVAAGSLVAAIMTMAFGSRRTKSPIISTAGRSGAGRRRPS
jgi:beta-glucanase (GH16 family)